MPLRTLLPNKCSRFGQPNVHSPSARCAAELAVLLALMLIAIGLRLWRLSAVSLRGDEAFSVLLASQPLTAILAQLGLTEPHPPLYYSLLHYWIQVAGDSELAVRLPSVAFGLLLVPLTYALARRHLSASPALLAAGFCALNSFLVWHSQDARMYTLFAAGALASLTAADRLLLGPRRRATIGRDKGAPTAVENPRDKRANHLTRRALGLVLANLVLLASHYASFYVIVAENAAFLLVDWRAIASFFDRRQPGSPRARAWIAAQAVTLALCLPWWIYARGLLLGHAIDWLSPESFGAALTRALGAYLLGPTTPSDLARLLAVPFVPALGLGLGAWIARRGPAGRAFIAYLIVPFAAVGLTAIGRPVFVDRYFIFAVPLLGVALAAGLAALHQRSRNGAVAYAGLLTLLIIWPLASYYGDPRTAKSPDWQSLAAAIGAANEPGDFVILNTPDPAPSYYLRRRGSAIESLVLPESTPPNRNATEAILTDLAGQRRRFWHVPIRDQAWDTDGMVERWLDTYTFALSEQHFGSLRLRLYATPAALLAAHERPEPLTFGGPPTGPASSANPSTGAIGATGATGAIEYLGYDLSTTAEPGQPDPITARPGSSLRLILYLRGKEPTAESYSVFSHLTDSAGQTRGQHDGIPVLGQHPTQSWRPGELVLDRHPIQLSTDLPVGSYSITFGFYEPSSGRRLTVTDSTGHSLGDSLTIGRIRIE